MGGEQAAGVLATVSRDQLEAARRGWPDAERGGVQGADPPPVRAQGHPYYATARLWDDGIIDPADTRRCWAWPLGGAQRPGRAHAASACSGCEQAPHPPDRQPRRDRLPHHPHGARAWASARSPSTRTPTRTRCTSRWPTRPYPIGPAPARESYLDVEAILEAARAPGRRRDPPRLRLSVRERRLRRGLRRSRASFIGPPPAAIARWAPRAGQALMAGGRRAACAGLPRRRSGPGALEARPRDRLPGADQGAAGGGGKGMRVVDRGRGLRGGSRQREARGAERVRRRPRAARALLDRPRHVEIQVFGDSHGNWSTCSSATARSSAATRR